MKIKSNDIESIRQVNTAMVLDKLRHADTLLTRPQVAALLDLSKVTISNIVKELNDQGLVTDAGFGVPDKRGGRKPVLIDLDRSRKKVLAASVGMNNLELVLGDISGCELKHLTAEPQSQKFQHLLLTMIDDILLSTNTPQEAIIGLAMSISRETMKNNFPACQHEAPQDSFLGNLKFPVLLVEPSEARAFSETWYGDEKRKSFLYVDLSHELNCVIVENNRLSSFKPRLGDCYLSAWPYESQEYGKNILVKSLIGGEALLERAAHAMGMNLTLKQLQALAHQQEPSIMPLLEEFGYWLGCALSLCINMTNPEVVVLGGEMCGVWNFYQNGLELGLSRHVPEERREHCAIKLLAEDMQNCFKGALAIALDTWIFRTELL